MTVKQHKRLSNNINIDQINVEGLPERIRFSEPQGAAVRGSVFGAFLAILPWVFIFVVILIQALFAVVGS